MGKNIRWIIVLLLFLVYMINYLDRVALSITVPMIEKDLALNAEQFGMIFGSFFFGYAVFNFIPCWCSACSSGWQRARFAPQRTR